MERILFEGTPLQIKMLTELIANVTKECGEYGVNDLPKQVEHYYLGNLWSVYDVIENYVCSEDDAREILEEVLNDEYTIQHIFNDIDYKAERSFFLKDNFVCHAVYPLSNSHGLEIMFNEGWAIFFTVIADVMEWDESEIEYDQDGNGVFRYGDMEIRLDECISV